MNLYREAEQFIEHNPKSGSLQNRIFDASRNKKIKNNPKHVYALVYSASRYKKFLKQIIRNSKLLEDKKIRAKEPLLILMAHDLLFSKNGRIQSGKHPLKDAFLAHKTRLQAELTKLKIKYKVKDLEELIEDDDTPVRWVRANLLKTSREKFLNEFKHLIQVESFQELEVGKIYHDQYIPNLFGVHPREKITSTDAYLKGRLIIQDRASCFPAHILHPSPGDKIIDTCSAPGNKTTHLASYLGNRPDSIIAFEKDPKRAEVLKTLCAKAGGLSCIDIQVGDFTATNPEDYTDIDGFVIDPSCSGSGIFGRAFEENEQDETYDDTRLSKLASFQFTIVRHAMMFPNAKKLTYSTCSVHPQENERVVVDLLKDSQVQAKGWKLCTRDEVIPDWNRRGFEEEFSTFENPKELAEGCIRSKPKEDGGIGFFVVAFKRDIGI
ncbi:25S rRNA (cytosine(2278)-C(5))-methyltransferase [Komagataella phaffii CBS 7435]|uniref:SAM-dependent MTase RsmB/NOP-type domain-containing protein n=2 Tax=Komagataella phaffii TaxID=460519 RepID=C4R2N3_KOMPG|nr:uncharacterized protein PAS_chr2-2_0167 [Komagataella phaffii GS115]AOA62479.1 GQ67_01176T0 [Komagataella phaffii]CAH2447688.1 25S rRNA (cytosine(2278)-C(5))-methyltransferase [Komagataella phaffii CBS 7435]AOA67616.1 GQ68_00213T0 [Komagataella phaffii GS115]CAY69757.1 Putative protein of unknown function with seven beta-strand methyltransferase motif [Komagataella phaffii GS115]CCA37871.1 25S rRNA (cytosine(2278)-C(5))-methyltransferase [Komagataella phaffii CBS 7435]